MSASINPLQIPQYWRAGIRLVCCSVVSAKTKHEGIFKNVFVRRLQ